MNAVLEKPRVSPTDRNEAASITPEELLRMPNEGRGYDLVDGILVERNMSRQSSRLAFRFCQYLGPYLDASDSGWGYGPDMGFRCFVGEPRKVRHADVAFVSLDRMPIETFEDGGFCTAVPSLVIEAVSIHDTASEVEAKTHEWLEAGVSVVWVGYPLREIIHEYRITGPIQVYRRGDALSADDVLPGFRVAVADLFRKPKGKS